MEIWKLQKLELQEFQKLVLENLDPKSWFPALWMKDLLEVVLNPLVWGIQGAISPGVHVWNQVLELEYGDISGSTVWTTL